VEPFQLKIAGALFGSEREKLVTLPRKNGESRLIGTFAVWHLLTTPRAAAYVAANSEEQARVVFEYARDVALHPAVEEEFEIRYRELRRPDGGFLRVHAADAGKLLGLTPTLAVVDEYCAAKDDSVYVALRSALLPGATLFTITTAGVGTGGTVDEYLFGIGSEETPTVWGARGYTAPHLTAGTAYVYSPNACYVVNRTSGFDIEIDRSRLFNIDSSETRFRARLDFFFPARRRSPARTAPRLRRLACAPRHGSMTCARGSPATRSRMA
jgi:hypothetical protein